MGSLVALESTISHSACSSVVSPVCATPAASQSQAISQQTQHQAATFTSSTAQYAEQQCTDPRINMALLQLAEPVLMSKSYKCPRPNCNKSYRQVHGLKYHMTHGSCDCTLPKDLEQNQALLVNKCRDNEEQMRLNEQVDVPEGQSAETDVTGSDAEPREVEKWLRPYACGVGECQRRYKSMGGLRECIFYFISSRVSCIKTS
ncbi:hypothetical protein NM688_g8874 [Phlebia brevispora]|uniref:Uncharacterized protein n=1 Tax=Phlebia brevispora TaxID=194682 RepID=A0ACC1RLY9_9APHY|nr:hypothetical protein NM688_g8874 [Phlebia brevispora]